MLTDDFRAYLRDENSFVFLCNYPIFFWEKALKLISTKNVDSFADSPLEIMPHCRLFGKIKAVKHIIVALTKCVFLVRNIVYTSENAVGSTGKALFD